MAFTLPDGFEWVLFMAVLLSIECFVFSFCAVMARRRHFTKAFFTRNFPELKGKTPDLGYPDMGSGHFASKLSLTDWLDFNHAQRVHLNMVEGIAGTITLVLACGAFWPSWAVKCAAAVFAGRLLYAIGYMGLGAKGRGPGILTVDVALIALGYGAISGVWGMGGGLDGLLAQLAL
eukprot:TRINITY_DN71183_c0_g1_i1.p2 TRINITY_DN71183_c0_g1~~TRINITY_DN71183_c0_g1_i1.p2  ORF type:complete len:176 (+),score=58.45 TRINITY_DN71183_c0_g1_i1:80-607(+)